MNFFNIINSLNKESKKVFSIIQKHGPLTKNKILKLTNFKLTTLNRIMKPLKNYNLIVETGMGKSSGGRKPILFDVNQHNNYIVGIDISRTYSTILITNLKMKILISKQFNMTEGYTPQKTAQKINNYLYNMIKQLNIDKSCIIGIGLGTIGPINREKGIILNPKDFPSRGWENTSIKNILENELNLPVIIDNGANTAVLAEKLFGVGKGIDNIAYFNCGIGIRTGVISSGNIVRTINDTADAFGHMIINYDGKRCNCGNYGCIECYCSINALRDSFTSNIKMGKSSIVHKPPEKITYIDILSAGEANDHLAKEIITNSAIIFGTGLSNYINLLNPNLVILSGPIIKYSNLFYNICTKVALNKYYTKDESKIIFSKEGYFKNQSIALGAAVMVFENYINN